MSFKFFNFRRAFNFSLALILIFITLPLLILTTIAVLFFLGTPVLLRQTRPGLNGKPFIFFKFRTMTDEVDSEGKLLPDSERLTDFGLKLRATSLDELPQLFNVLFGDMSFVGPRPLLMEYLSLYSDEQKRRHDVLPGITGWAQINGRNTLSWDEKFKLDVWYVDNQSFFLDLKILFLTLKKVLIREGISANGEATMTKFTGN
jgi:lipopolysaccharide/colanic/teichoic acid biosynthesis glycosyltransferase